MIKLAEPYLDVISYAKDNFNVPIAAYQVSGEYSRLVAAACADGSILTNALKNQPFDKGRVLI